MRDPKYLHPKLQVIHAEFVKRCAEKGIKILTYMTRRSLEEQAELYAKGRTKPGKIVTNAKPGYSWHNFDLAFDCVEVKGGNCLWSNPNWSLIGQIGEELGLIWGGNFKSIKDKPHFEYHPGLTLAQAREMHAKGEDLLAHVPTPEFILEKNRIEAEKIAKEKEEKKEIIKQAIVNKEDNVIEANFAKKITSKHPLIDNIITILKNLFGL